MVLDESTGNMRDNEDCVMISDEEDSPREGFVKTLQEIAEEEEKDVYDPAILGTRTSISTV